MKNTRLSFLLCLFSLPAVAQTVTDSSEQYMLIVRYQPGMKLPAPELLQKNGQHWGIFLQGLAQTKKLVTAFRPGNEGITLSGADQNLTKQPFNGGGETVSSIIIIHATTQAEAESIARKCPIFEVDGSVEIRRIQNTQ